MFPEHVEDLMKKRYYLSGEVYKNYYGHDGIEDWEMLCRRVAKTIAKNNPDFEETYFDLVFNKIFLPNSPTLFGAGVNGLCYSACFVIPMEDSIEGWANSFRFGMKIQTAGGGCGFPLHHLRPFGFPVSGKRASAAGPIEFMKCWDQISKSFSQAVRNGANMGTLRVDHPNIEEFISCKDKDGEISNFNISVALTDKFMRAVETNSSFDLMWKGKTIKTINAKELWDKICLHAWKTGEPGLMFYDTVQTTNPHPEAGEFMSNPCLHPDSEMMTSEFGLVKIKELCNREFHTFDYDGVKRKVTKVWKSGTKQIVKLCTKSGIEICCTPDHKILCQDGRFIEAKDMLNKTIKFSYSQDWDGVLPEEYIGYDFTYLGFIFGDGSYHKASKRVKYVFIGSKDEDVMTYFKNGKHSKSFDFECSKNSCAVGINHGFCDNLFTETLPKRNLPSFVKHLPQDELKQFMKGLFSANGFVINDKKSNLRIGIKMVNLELIKDIQKLLLMFGIKSNIQSEEGTKVEFSNGIYQTKQSHCLKISDLDSMKLFEEQIGFLQFYKNMNLNDAISIKSSKQKQQNNINYFEVISINDFGVSDVYDFTQEETSCGSINGLIVHNCFEYNGYMGSACNLGSINIARFYENNTFDYDRFENVVELSYRFLDDLIEVNQYPIPYIESVVKNFRPIGLGIMGLADLLIKAGIRYGSAESLVFVEKIMSVFSATCERMNVRLGKERGSYTYLVNLNNGQVRRNLTHSCVAPTGTISMIAGCSSGIEPVFSFDPITRIIAGEKKLIFEQIKHSDNRVNVSANELTMSEHIDMTALVQKHVNMAISKTINLPKNATVEDVKKAYEMSWKMGIKGITVYRDGSRQNQTLQTKDSYSDEKKQESITITKKREYTPLIGETFKDKIGCGAIFTTVNYDEKGNVHEVFIRPGKHGGCQSNVEGLARMASIALRSGVDVKEIVDQLKGIRCPSCLVAKQKGVKFLSCPDAIGKAIEHAAKRHGKFIVHSETKSEPNKNETDKCPDCGTKIINEGGCKVCKHCGYSKCG